MIKEAITLVVDGHNLSENMMVDVMNQVMGGEATSAQIASLITALRMKGETIEEITGAARVMRQHATPIRVGHTLDLDREEINTDRETILDTCGTGGSNTKTFNVSTTVAFVVASCGVKVAKHGNRSISSACGSADVLEELGVNLNVSPATVEQCVQELNLGFLFAPALHGAMKYAIGPRREVGIRTIFNLLGPLTNPAGADHQVLGVYQKNLVQPIAEVLNRLGCKRGFVVHGCDGMDEITMTGETTIASIENGQVTMQVFKPESLGFDCCQIEDLQGGDAICNAEIIRSILNGLCGPRRDIVVINSAFALVAAGVVQCLEDGVRTAEEVIDNGLAKAKLSALVRMTNQ
ncbi:MAG: anthranilate phosphoribosyltransferase [Deltaproteobacteria bacterium]|nr:anthranilate phosphoribosyltransferase [Deltaproteobacteria bacterium]